MWGSTCCTRRDEARGFVSIRVLPIRVLEIPTNRTLAGADVGNE